MRKILVVLIVALMYGNGNLNAQERKLFLIAGQGCPGNCKADDPEYDKSYPVHLFTINKDSLFLYHTISSMQNVNRIASFYENKMAIVYKSEVSYKERKFTILKINYDNALRLDSIVKIFPIEAYFGDKFYLIDLGVPWIIIEYYPFMDKKPDSVFYYGLNLNTGKDSLFTNQVIKYMNSEGEQGCIVSNKTDVLDVGIKMKNGKLIHHIKEPRISTKDTCNLTFPKFEQLVSNYKYISIPDKDPNECIPIPIYNKNIICISSTGNWNDVKLSGTSKFEIFTHNNTWKTITFPGRSSDHGLHQFGNWLSGYVSYIYRNEYLKIIEKNGSIPGKRYRLNKSIYGMSFDERADYIKIFLVGKLFLYNIESDRYFEWNAIENGEPQGDSEILLVQDEIVYYRINDKIYKASIVNGEKLGEPILLVKDSRVPDIHWAFISRN